MAETSHDAISVLYVGRDEAAAANLVDALAETAPAFEVETVLSTNAAVEFVESQHVDCIVSRYELPGADDGIALLEELRDRRVWLPFVLVPDNSFDVAGEAVAADVDRYTERTTPEETAGALAAEITAVVDEYRPSADLVDRMTDGFLAVDDEWRITYLNERAREVVGSVADGETDFRGRSLWEAIPGITDTEFEENCRLAVASQETRSFESYYDPLGSWFEIRLFPSPTGLSVYFYEITDRRQYEQVLEGREQVLRDIYSIISAKDKPFTRKVQQLLEIGREELGMTYGSLSRIEDDKYTLSVVAGPEHDVITEGTTVDLAETNCQRVAATGDRLALADTSEEAPDLTDRLVYELGIESYLGVPILVDDTVEGTFCFYDFGTREEPFTQWEMTLVDLMGSWVSYERERERQQAELERERNRLDAVAGTLSHDLRNPLATASLRLELAADECSSEHLDALETALDRIDELIENTLSMARLGTDALDIEVLRLEVVANQAWDTAVDSEATLELDDSLGRVYADESTLQQLFENLFANALEHGQPETGHLVVRVGQLDDGFYVVDNGPGLPAESRDEIFERGYSTNDAGTGFGLAIVERIADAHGGNIVATDAEDSGARFEVRGLRVH